MPGKRKFERTPGQPLDEITGMGYKGWLGDVSKGIIFGLAHAGIKFSEIARITKTTEATVSRTIKTILGALEASEASKPRPEDTRTPQKEEPDDEDEEEPPAFQPKDLVEAKVYAEMMKMDAEGQFVHKNSRDIRQALADSGMMYSVRTIQRYVKALGGDWVVRPVTSPLTPERMQKRVETAKQLLQMFDEDPTLPSRIVFTDESILRAEDMNLYALRRPGHDVQPRRKSKWAASVMVWGAIGVGLKQLVFLRDTVNAENYTSTLDEFLFASQETDFLAANRVLMHDGARPHTAKFTAEALAEKKIVVIPWAAYSPDWNPIENLWSILKRRMNTTCFDDKDRLEDVAYNTWEAIPQEMINDLCLSFRKRLVETVARNGEDCQV